MTKYKYPITAINRNGQTKLLYTFHDIRSFCKEHGWWGEEWQMSWMYYFIYGARNYHPSVPWHWNHKEPVQYEWIMRDEWGQKVIPTDFDFTDYSWRSKRIKEIRHAEALGLPIPGQRHCSGGWKQNAPAKKNSGSGHRNRNRGRFEEDRKEYGIKNRHGKVRPWEGY